MEMGPVGEAGDGAFVGEVEGLDGAFEGEAEGLLEGISRGGSRTCFQGRAGGAALCMRIKDKKHAATTFEIGGDDNKTEPRTAHGSILILVIVLAIRQWRPITEPSRLYGS